MTQTRGKTRAERQAELMAQKSAEPSFICECGWPSQGSCKKDKNGVCVDWQADAGVRGIEVAPAPREPTATERLEALKEREMATDGYLIPPPANLYEALPDRHGCPEQPTNRCCCRARKWLKEISEIGSSGHVEIAWVRGIQDVYVKGRLRNYYEQMLNEAGRRHFRLEEQAAAERAAEHAASLERAQIANKARTVAGLEARLAVLKAEG